MIQEDPLYEKAKAKALRLLSYRGRSKEELRSKLSEKGFDEAVIRKVIDRFSELKYLDDEIFARDWARHLALYRLWGDRKIEISLRGKGIDRQTIDGAILFAREEIGQKEAIERLIEKRQRRKSSQDIDYKEKRRLAQNLLGRGFPPPLIFDVLGKVEEGYIDNGE
ncbi:MAG: regulatory protein RecX [Thermodesulfobacteriota bacterium]|nr:regulatory protein RecX [Thermodesulfobacteriota bacterium]